MSASNVRPSNWLTRQPVKPSRRPRIRVVEPAPGQSFVERFCTEARKAEIRANATRRLK